MAYKYILAAGATIAVIIASLFLTGLVPVSAKGNVIVTLRDSETGKPIGKVDSGYVRVMLGGKDQGYLTDKGELMIKNVEPGTHELVLVVPYVGEVRQYVEVGPGETVTANVTVNMPNPEFLVTINVDQPWYKFYEWGNIKITISNTGEIRSVGTKALVLVYREDNPDSPADSHILDFGYLSEMGKTGDTKTLEWGTWAFEPGTWEAVAVVIFDGWQFTPQNKQVVSQVTLPPDAQERIVASLLNYAEQHSIEIAETIAKIVIGWFG
ncbi:hypothetical protein DRO54_08960 [Candidatus Bathyarchaeota archaeon]|nr:MAG: hypothetical protein DRO54_08960 [Candidatus Bathyarchaeota archaeon]